MPPDETTATVEAPESAAAPESAPAEAAPETKPSPAERRANRKAEVMERVSDTPQDVTAGGVPMEEETEPPAESKEKPEKPAAPEGESEVFFNEKAGRWQQGGNFISRDKAAELGADVESVPTAGSVSTETEGEKAGTEEAEKPASEEPAGETITLEGIDGRGNPVEIEIPAGLEEQQARTLKMWANDSKRARTMLAEAEEKEADLRAFEERVETDPVGVVMEHMPAERRVDVARALLADDAVYGEISKDLEDWSYDPEKREKSAAEIRAERAEAELRRREKADRQRVATRELNRVQETIDETVDEPLRLAAYDIMENHIRSSKVIPTDDEVLDVLRARGLTDAAAPSASSTTRTTPASPDSSAAPSEEDSPAEPAQVKGSSAPNRAALATTPPGGTTPGTRGLNVPKDIKLRGEKGTTAKDFILGRLGRRRSGA